MCFEVRPLRAAKHKYYTKVPLKWYFCFMYRKNKESSAPDSNTDRIFDELRQAHPKSAVYGPPAFIGVGSEALVKNGIEDFIGKYVETSERAKEVMPSMSRIAIQASEIDI